ncbi:MAG TPA: PorP/SprF family type IX secretion system membrane protein [Flavobacterium sp.]|jgi:type IX secretion system PorP/SprF family membrane protein
MKYTLLITIFMTICCANSNAQDPVFTQYFLVPETLNPGFTAYLDTWHAGILHRTQWPDGDRRIDTEYAFVNAAIGDFAGLGITILNHREKFTGYNYLQINGAYSYKVELNDEWSFRPGIEAGYGQKSYGFGGLLLEDQININTGEISDGSVDPGVMNYSSKINFFDVSAGFVVDKEDAWFGASLKHLNRPGISFTESGNVPLEMLLSVHGGYAFNIYGTRFMFLPEETKLLLTGNYLMQSEYNRFDLGSALVFEMFTFGATAATNPGRKSSNSHFVTSVNAFGSVQVDHFIIGGSYDLNTSRLGNTRGIFELSLTWQLDFNYKCWGCPNYQVQLRKGGRAGYQRR